MTEDFVRLCGEVGNYSEKITGISIVDAYFGPDELDPSRQENKDADVLLHDLDGVMDSLEIIEDEIRREYLLAELKSMKMTVKWLAGIEQSYSTIVQTMFNIEPKKFSESIIEKQIEAVDESLREFPGEDLAEKASLFTKEGQVRGKALRDFIDGELQSKSADVGQLFRDRIYTMIGQDVTDNGVKYNCVTDKPWSGYNYFKGNYTSVNEFNVDRPMNIDSALAVVYHEYEHHVSNLWRERAYREDGFVELSIVPLHTGRCVISEGTADTARDFLGVKDGGPKVKAFDALYKLRRMIAINSAIMLNLEKKSVEETVQYNVERGLRDEDASRSGLGFISPRTRDGRVNIWSPYVFTYYIGRTQFVYPMFAKAREQNELTRFYQTLYLNPFSGSSATWEKAFAWL
ncbi:MAG: hypothetical protein BAJATHORv1_40009 [Candidatus Thorarchaeota archaeon]|nr:MAG: hypothetical protein BAJATHORv1_40009 [Candidatus Thorarchaeota archaeon]